MSEVKNPIDQLRGWAGLILAQPEDLLREETALLPEEVVLQLTGQQEKIVDTLWRAIWSSDAAVEEIEWRRKKIEVDLGCEDEPAAHYAFRAYYEEELLPAAGIAYSFDDIIDAFDAIMVAFEDALLTIYMTEHSAHPQKEKVLDQLWSDLRLLVDDHLITPEWRRQEQERFAQGIPTHAYDATLTDIYGFIQERNLHALRNELLNPTLARSEDDKRHTPVLTSSLGSTRQTIQDELFKGRMAPAHRYPSISGAMHNRFMVLTMAAVESLLLYGQSETAQQLLQEISPALHRHSAPAHIELAKLLEQGYDLLMLRALRQQRLAFVATISEMTHGPFQDRGYPVAALRRAHLNGLDLSLYRFGWSETLDIMHGSLSVTDETQLDDDPLIDRLEAGILHDAAEAHRLMRLADEQTTWSETLGRAPAQTAQAALARGARLLADAHLIEEALASHEISDSVALYSLVAMSREAYDELYALVGDAAIYSDRIRTPMSKGQDLCTMLPIAGTRSGIVYISALATTAVPVDLVKQQQQERRSDLPFILEPEDVHALQASRSRLNARTVQKLVADACAHPPEHMSTRVLYNIVILTGYRSEPSNERRTPVGVAIDCDCCGRLRIATALLHEIEDTWNEHGKILSDQDKAAYLRIANCERAQRGILPAASIDELLTASVRWRSPVEYANEHARPALASMQDTPSPPDPYEDLWENFTL